MEMNDQLTMAHGMGKIEGVVNGMTHTVESHVRDDADRFKAIMDELQVIKSQRFMDTQDTLQRERELSKWKWSTVWAIVGAIFGGSAVALVSTILKEVLK